MAILPHSVTSSRLLGACFVLCVADLLRKIDFIPQRLCAW